MAYVRSLATICVIAALLSCLVGCTFDREVAVESGVYVVAPGQGPANQDGRSAIQQVRIDRDGRLAVFYLADGSEMQSSFIPRGKAEWPVGCPTNIGSTRMEVLDIAQDTLTAGPLAFRNPILVRDCPPDPMRIVLREDGDIGNARGVSGSACSWTDTCVTFGPKRDPRWRANDSAMSTTQDIPVTFDITVSADEEHGRIDARTFAITEGPANGTVISNLELTGTITEETGFSATGTFVIRIVDLVTYTPNAGFQGTDTFTYRICDMDGTCDTATVTVTVAAADDGQGR